jgi:DNA mismatch repair protein MutS
MSNNSESLYQEYYRYSDKYKEKYGEKSLVLMQVGSFYEVYSANGRGPNLFELSRLLNIQHTRRDKGKAESDTNPQIVGFNENSLEKFLEILVNNDYTVIVYDQEKSAKVPGQKVPRFENGTYTKSTFISNTSQNSSNNYLVCIYIVNEPQKNSHPLKSCGISAVDLTTGEVYVHSAFSEKYDEHIALDEVARFINNTCPSEVLIYYNNEVKKVDEQNIKEYFYSYFNIDSNKCRYYEKIDEKYKKLSFQNELLKKVYSEFESQLEPIEQFNLERESNIVVSLCLLFDYVNDKVNSLLRSLKPPSFCFDKQHLSLLNNAVEQLDIFDTQSNTINKIKYNSVFSVVNFCRTGMGERYLRHLLSSPLTSKEKLENMYNITEKMINLKIPDQIRNHLDTVRDIERLSRRIQLKMIKPCELVSFVNSYQAIKSTIEILHKTKKFKDIIKSDSVTRKIDEFDEEINKIFDLEKLSMCLSITFEKGVVIYNKNVHKEIDELVDNIDSGTKTIELLRDILFDLFPKPKNKKADNSGKVIIKHNDRDGYYLKLTKKNAEQLKKILDGMKTLKVGSKQIKVSDFFFSYNKDTAKITLPESLNEHTDKLEVYSEQISELYKKYYLQDIEKIYEKYSSLFLKCNEIITRIDFHQSAAKCAMEFGYCRPEIIESEDSILEIKELRHPVIERIISCQYVPHDVKLDDNLRIMMIYGLNSAGKSSYIKSIAIAVIMASAGLYVPAKSFKSTIFKTLMCRISANDCLQKGMSSFSIEVNEINSIIKRSQNKTLIICDEILKSTEYLSGMSLVASTLMKFDKLKCLAVVASHMHNLMELDEIKSIKTLKAYHIHAEYDAKLNAIVYDRKLLEGHGKTMYGLEVAKYMVKDNEFIDNAVKIKNKLLQQHDSIISGKVSHFNSNVYVYECSVCGTKDNLSLSNLHVHHIEEQHEFNENDTLDEKPHIKKNMMSNLVPLCVTCHDRIHKTKDLDIKGYLATSKGRKLQVEKKEKNK